MDCSKIEGGLFYLRNLAGKGLTFCDLLQSVCFIAEFCTPGACMRKMVDDFKFAGLSEEEMAKQCDDFAEILPEIIGREAVKRQLGDISHLVQLICYDGKFYFIMFSFS